MARLISTFEMVIIPGNVSLKPLLEGILEEAPRMSPECDRPRFRVQPLASWLVEMWAMSSAEALVGQWRVVPAERIYLFIG